MTSSHDDEKHRAAMDLAGLQAYGAYWIICEKIAAQIRPECVSTSLQLSWKSWASSLQVDPRVARRLVRVIGESRLAIVEETDNGARVNIPNLLKYGDEYTKKVLKKSGQTPDKLPTMSGSPAVPALPAVPDKPKIEPLVPRPGNGRFTPPTIEQVSEYCRARNNQVDAVKFHAYYTSNGWKVGKNPMKNWKAAVVSTWEKN